MAAIKILARALNSNRSSTPIWLHYMNLYAQHAAASHDTGAEKLPQTFGVYCLGQAYEPHNLLAQHGGYGD